VHEALGAAVAQLADQLGAEQGGLERPLPHQRVHEDHPLRGENLASRDVEPRPHRPQPRIRLAGGELVELNRQPPSVLTMQRHQVGTDTAG
jgi:hypothetical protein